VQQAYCGYPIQHQLARYPDLSSTPAFYQQHHQVPFREMALLGSLLPPPPTNFGLMPSNLLLNYFLANIHPALHQSFLQNFLQNMMEMQAAANTDLLPPQLSPRKGD
jgi:hypothetical protein